MAQLGRVAPGYHPNSLMLAYAARGDARHIQTHPSIDEFVLRYWPTEYSARYFRCSQSVLRWRAKDAGPDDPDTLSAERCKCLIVCGTCAQVEAGKRRWFQRSRFAGFSLDEGVPAGFRVVWTCPPFLAPLLKRPEGLGAFADAVAQTIADAWGTRSGGLTKRERRAWWRLHGAVWNLHATGHQQPTFLGWHPHLDGTLNAYEFTTQDRTSLQLMSAYWPSYERTRNRFRVALREHMKKPLSSFGRDVLGADGALEAYAQLGTEFKVNLHVSCARDGRNLLRGPELSFDYATRPLWNPAEAHLQKNSAGEHVIVYTPRGRAAHTYVVDPVEAVRTILELRDKLQGSEVTRWMGYYGRSSYAHACRSLGVAPVLARGPKGQHRRLGEYRPDRDGFYSNPERGYFGEV